MNLNEINPKVISEICRPDQIEEFITILVEKLKIANKLADAVLKINPKSGEIGEGFATYLIAKAEQFKVDIEVTDSKTDYTDKVLHKVCDDLESFKCLRELRNKY